MVAATSSKTSNKGFAASVNIFPRSVKMPPLSFCCVRFDEDRLVGCAEPLRFVALDNGTRWLFCCLRTEARVVGRADGAGVA